jgi:Tol biopolymer transport system component/DNA-binding winged helix-turn-helix (wHTH) protein
LWHAILKKQDGLRLLVNMDAVGWTFLRDTLLTKGFCMPGNLHPHSVISFGPFAADLQTQELKKHGVRLRLPGQSFQILKMLLERPGELVSREELHAALWPSDTFVDFEKGINAAVKRLREALGDSPDEPKLIETLPKRGYRFVGTITKLQPTPVLPVAYLEGRPSWLKVGAWILAVAVCALMAVFAYSRFWHRAESLTFTPVPFTAYAGNELFPKFSPDGSQIVFAWDGDPPPGSKGFDLYVKVIGSENLLRLTHHPAELIAAVWSPNGAQIAFYRIAGAETGIYVVPSLGGPERRLRSPHHSPNADSHAPPMSWSPDGKWIAFSEWHAAEGGWRLHLLSVETLESPQVPHVAECLHEGMPAFSHSGKQLAYFCVLKTEDNEIGVYSIATVGGPPRLVTRLMTGWNFPAGLAWTADDKKLILSRPRIGDDFELDEVTVADGSLRKLPFGQGAMWPAISAKGDQLAFVVGGSPHVDIWRKDLLHPEAAVKFLSSTHDQNGPQYSPDGKHIAFASDRGGTWEIWMSDADGSRLVRMSDIRTSEAGSPRWSPDSQKIAFDSRHSSHPEVYIVDISERLPRKLITNLPDLSEPSWSHDGKWLYFQARTALSPLGRIYRCPAIGGDAAALSEEFGSFPSESFDGETVYFANKLDGPRLLVASLNPVGPELVLKGVPALDAGNWTVVSGGIYFVPADAPMSVHYFDFATKRLRQIFKVEADIGYGLSVSPDGRWILYTQVAGRNADIMLLDHLH